MTLIGAGVAASGPLPASADPNDGGPSAAVGVDSSRAIVMLVGDPLSTSTQTKPGPGKKIDFDSTTTRSYRAELNERRKAFKTWLRANAPKVKVTGEFDISLNAVSVELNGTPIATLRRAPQAARVELEGIYTPLDDVALTVDPDLLLIQAEAAWGNKGAADAGTGIKVGIVDTGIDITHPCFSEVGYASQPQIGDKAFTNNKVIVAKVFNNRTSQRYTAEAIGDHGTHVAGTVACNAGTAATVDGAAIPYAISGVAPHALLGNYNVFPGTVGNARSEDILNALDAAYADGMDVINMSLGGGAHGAQDLLTVATDNLDRANVVVAVAAGNDGPGADTVGSPGSAARALTAGASTVPHFVGATLTVNGTPYGIASGDFATVSPDFTAPLGVVSGPVGGLSTACAPLGTGSLIGTIAVISRGTCSFTVKITNAQNAGAAAVIVVNNVAGDPTAMGTDDSLTQPTIPAYMISLASRGALVGSSGKSAMISADLAYVRSHNANIMAGFSSQGPTDVTRRIKPDVVAPGVNVLSSIPMKDCKPNVTCFAFFSGTSMATPHLAGSAAIVRQRHPGWTAAQVRSAIVNTATEGVLKDYKDDIAPPVTNPNIVGAGLENLLAAVQASVTLDPVSVSFGRIPSGSGQTRSALVTITNTSTGNATFMLGAEAPFTVSPSSVLLAAGQSASVTVTVATVKGQTANGVGSLRIAIGTSPVAHAVLFFEVG